MRQTYHMMRMWGSGRTEAARLAWALGRQLKHNDPIQLTDTWGRPTPHRASQAQRQRQSPRQSRQ
jgi:hypothetical protein